MTLEEIEQYMNNLLKDILPEKVGNLYKVEVKGGLTVWMSEAAYNDFLETLIMYQLKKGDKDEPGHDDV